MNEFNRAKQRIKSVSKLWYICVPVWFVISVITMFSADALQNNQPLIASTLRFAPLIAIPVWVFVVVKLGGFQGPANLKCEKCNAPAFDKSYEIDWKFEGPTRDFKDICPNCGNDNRTDLNAQ